MKKYFTSSEYKELHNRRLYNRARKPKRNKRYIENRTFGRYSDISSSAPIPIYAPADFRLIDNTEACLSFFRNIRNDISQVNGKKFVLVSLLYVTKIDYATISVLTSISDDLKSKHVSLQGDFPFDTSCKQFMIGSGFLSHMYNKGKKYPKVAASELIFFEKGSGVLSTEDNIKISTMVKNVVNHLTGEMKYCLPVKTIILEICGNSIEWGGTDDKQWLLGVKYEPDCVKFTVTDVGRGILTTLNRKFKFRLVETFTGKRDHEILQGAFNQKYGSNTQEINRNKGLPAVKSNFEQGTIKNLKVLTNNVILHFDNALRSRTFKDGAARFKGTFYQWEMTKDCIENLQT